MEYLTFLLAGSIFLIVGIYFLRDRIVFIKNGIETYATVIRIEVSLATTEEEKTSYIPHFKAITHDGKEIIFIYGKSTEWGKWSIGDQVKMVYNDSFPYDIVVLTFWGTYRNIVILLALAFIFLTVGCLHYWS